jgi:N-acetylneuraminic acid mutarotase
LRKYHAGPCISQRERKNIVTRKQQPGLTKAPLVSGAMRHQLSVPVLGLAAVLSGCDHSSATTTTPAPPATYSIGGSIAGLSGTIVLQNNGSDNLTLSRDGPFTFSVTLQPNSPYDVTVATQPANETCTVSNASGSATGEITNIQVVCGLSSGASDVWTWIGGANYVNAPGVYGTQGTASNSNAPGARRQAVAWTDTAGNFWLFGGNSSGNIGTLNDLWEYSPSAQQWVWQNGADVVGVAAVYGSQGTPAASNNPGAREGAASWTDATGNLWLFGGDTLASQSSEQFNDLWSYSPSSGLWTWVSGANQPNSAGMYGTQGTAAPGNVPPARTGAISWVDANGVFWLFGGAQLNANASYLAVFNDLWSFNPLTGLWTWVGGPNTPNSAGVYGTQGTAAAGNVPAARASGNVWLDASGNVWLFGGLGLSTTGLAQEYNDLWEYSPVTGQWTWIAGSNVADAAGIYGTQHAGAAGNGPGARVSAVSWTDSTGNFWLFGGYGYAQPGDAGDLNDLWEYNLGTGVWTWIDGSSAAATSGIYGELGVAAIGNDPGAREQGVGWLDSQGNFWLFGGFGFDSSGEEADLNDLWRFAQSP